MTSRLQNDVFFPKSKSTPCATDRLISYLLQRNKQMILSQNCSRTWMPPSIATHSALMTWEYPHHRMLIFICRNLSKMVPESQLCPTHSKPLPLLDEPPPRKIHQETLRMALWQFRGGDTPCGVCELQNLIPEERQVVSQEKRNPDSQQF